MDGILCLGGPKDAERVTLAPHIIRSGWFVAHDPVSPTHCQAFYYHLVRLRDESGEHIVALGQDDNRTPIARLIDGYAPHARR